MADSLSSTQRAEIRDYFTANPNAMTMLAARELNVPEADVLSCFQDETTWELDCQKFTEILETMSQWGKVHVIVSNQATTIEAFGEFGGFSEFGPFFNVQTSSLDMHIRKERISRAFSVIKPSHVDGVPTLSVQFFDDQGTSAFKVFLTFGGKQPSPEKHELWETLRDRFRTTPSGQS